MVLLDKTTSLTVDTEKCLEMKIIFLNISFWDEFTVDWICGSFKILQWWVLSVENLAEADRRMNMANIII